MARGRRLEERLLRYKSCRLVGQELCWEPQVSVGCHIQVNRRPGAASTQGWRNLGWVLEGTG